jgi:hypothetical protein
MKAIRSREPLFLPGVRKLMPAGFVHFHIVLLGRVFDALPRFVAFLVRNALHLVEPGDCVADVRGVVDRFFALLGKSELASGDLVSLFFVDFAH